MKYIAVFLLVLLCNGCPLSAQSSVAVSGYTGFNFTKIDGVPYLGNNWESNLSRGITYGASLEYSFLRKMIVNVGLARQSNSQKFHADKTFIIFDLAYSELFGFLGYSIRLSDKIKVHPFIGVRRYKKLHEHISEVQYGLPTVIFFEDQFYSLSLKNELSYKVGQKINVVGDLWIGMSTFQEQKYYSLGLNIGLSIHL